MDYGPKPNCPWRKPRKHPLDRADKIAHVVGGALLGALASSVIVTELFFAIAISERGTLWVPAGVAGASALLGGVLGAWVGTPFIDWMSEHWHLFWRH